MVHKDLKDDGTVEIIPSNFFDDKFLQLNLDGFAIKLFSDNTYQVVSSWDAEVDFITA